jgi:AcrR family transcriptional regulator
MNNEHTRLEILNWVESGFLNYGYKNFSMEEIASDLHISKKTIYKFFRTKEELTRAAIINQLSNPYRKVISIIKDETDIVEKFIDLSKMVEQYYSAFNETSLERLRHYFKDLADYVDQFRIHRIISLIKQLLKDGKEKELILDIPDEIIIKVFTSALGAIAISKLDNFSNYSYHQTFRQAFNILLNGILTEKGKQILNHKLKDIK